MNLGVQYYRPPFPMQRFWEDDFKRIADSGLNTVQLWVLWSWVESKPGEFRFEDYDRLVELAEKNGLGLVLSTIAEVQPYWIHREVPGSEMIDSMGHPVVSSNRSECHFGITPGGCTDNPGVWDRMSLFLQQVVRRYAPSPALRGWDAWNELRWNVNADGLVCYCPHTIQAFRDWLSEKYGGLDGLNKAWIRRYGQWDEVMPGKKTARPYTEMMAFSHFITERANRHARNRYDIIKAIDAAHPVTVHGGDPSMLHFSGEHDTALNRGNDWNYADHLDGVGCSNFPKWFNTDDAEFGMRVECVKSAARNKQVWLSEVQGGRASQGFDVHQPVDAVSQQRWIWNGLACGASTILFWCWRDEVFGSESGGFGLIGKDSLAEERLDAMRATGRVLKDNAELIDNYKPSAASVGVWFSPQSYYLCWSQETRHHRAMQAIQGYARSLTRSSIPYTFIEEEHLDALDTFKIIFLPRTIVFTEKAEQALEAFVRKGGTLVCESECGAFTPVGIYRYSEDRFIAKLTGVADVGRRSLPLRQSVTATISDTSLELPLNQWTTPLEKGKGKILAENDDGPLIVNVPVGAGKVILCGSYFGNGYYDNRCASFEEFVAQLVNEAGCQQDIRVLSPKNTSDSFVYIKSGKSLGRRVVFVFFPKDTEKVELEFAPNLFQADTLTDIISNQTVKLDTTADASRCTLKCPECKYVILTEV